MGPARSDLHQTFHRTRHAPARRGVMLTITRELASQKADNMRTMRKELESRWLPEYDKHGIVKTVKPHFAAAFDLIDSISKKRADVNADKRFSDVGRTDEMQK